MLTSVVRQAKKAGIDTLTKEGAAFAMGYGGGRSASSQERWFSEREVLWPGQKFSLKVKKELFRGKSKFQDVLVFESTNYGKVLVLDGVIQMTERDEHAYQEMIAHIPIFAHPNPKSVLIIGGGDGGVLREVTRHKDVKRIVMCEIDSMVIEVSKKFGFSTATAFEDPRVELLIEDAVQYIKSHRKEFDIIIVDSSDPEGPAELLFERQFYMDAINALRPGGVVCTQGECMWLHLDLIANVLKSCRDFVEVADYAFTTIPTYPSGQIGFILLSNDKSMNLCKPSREPSATMASLLRYYRPAVHRAAFVLPAFAERAIREHRKGPGKTE